MAQTSRMDLKGKVALVTGAGRRVGRAIAIKFADHGAAMRRIGAGKIVNLGDWAGTRPYKDYLPYSVSKCGMIGLTRALAKELAPEVQVNCIALGMVMPPEEYSKREVERLVSRTLTKKMGAPEDVARAVMFFCEATDFATGATLALDGGRLLVSNFSSH